MVSEASEGIDLDGLASSLTKAFIRGEYNEECSAALRTLLPGISHTSISVVAGDKVMVTEENILKPGFASVHFERVDETVSGQAYLTSNMFEAKLSSSRSFADLDRAHSNESCSRLVSLPIPRPKRLGRRASFDSPSGRPSPSTTARGSATAGSGATTQDDCSEHLAAFSQRREQAPMGCITIGLAEHCHPSMTHLNNLRLLAGILAPILESQSRTVLDGLKTAFGQTRVDTMAGAGAPSPETAVAPGGQRWDSLEGVDDMVDSMLSRGSPYASGSDSSEAIARTT